jgi:hypothetical protein
MSDYPLFESTSQIAGHKAAQKSGAWRRRILDYLRVTGGATLGETAAYYEVPDHTISGRFTALGQDLVIERTGQRRPHPTSGNLCDVWRIVGARNDPQPDVAELLGYPLELRIDGDLYDRQSLLPHEGYPGIPYARRADTGGARLLVRVELIECPGCGKPLKLIEEPLPPSAGGGKKKVYRCGLLSCNKTWSLVIAQIPGQPAGVPALVGGKV